jgi:hypothetical protein
VSLSKLEEAGYISSKKGAEAFSEYIKTLETYTGFKK